MRPTDKATVDSRSVEYYAIVKNTGHGNFGTFFFFFFGGGGGGDFKNFSWEFCY